MGLENSEVASISDLISDAERIETDLTGLMDDIYDLDLGEPEDSAYARAESGVAGIISFLREKMKLKEEEISGRV